MIDEYIARLEAETYTPEDASKREVRELKLEEYGDLAKESLAPLGPDAVTQVYRVMMYATSDATRLKAATYVLDKLIGKDEIGAGDPLQDLIDELRGNKISASAAS
jgi:hypothetical protein